MDIIKINQVKKSLNNHLILKGINLHIKKGEIIALVGPSGCGKSTLLRCINRLIEIDSGSIIINNQNIQNIYPIQLRQQVVFVHQESSMLNGTVYDNVAFGLKLRGTLKKDSIHQSLKDVGLSKEFSEKEASKLSGGEKKRVALARALALRPQVLLLDEPSAGLDPKKIQTIEETIINFSKKRQLTVVWVTHDINQAKRVSIRIANMKEGKINNMTKTESFQWEGAY
jgi:putative ABC transport system ATP-binding protein